jgi:hypothetical protein
MDASQKNSQSAYVLPLICSFGIPAENLSVEFGPEFDRLAYPDPGLESSINQTWEARLAQQPSLFNGSKFRVSPSLDNRASKKLPSLQQHPHHCHSRNLTSPVCSERLFLGCRTPFFNALVLLIVMH